MSGTLLEAKVDEFGTLTSLGAAGPCIKIFGFD